MVLRASPRLPRSSRWPPCLSRVPGRLRHPVAMLPLGEVSRVGRWAVRTATRCVISAWVALVAGASGQMMCMPPLVERSMIRRPPAAVSQWRAISTSRCTAAGPPRVESKSSARMRVVAACSV